MADARLQRLEDTIHDLADVIRKDRSGRAKQGKKLPTFKFKGNQQQYEFNDEILDSLDDLKELVAVGSVNRSTEVIENLEGTILKRQKLLKLADRSPGGWDTVRDSVTSWPTTLPMRNGFRMQKMRL